MAKRRLTSISTFLLLFAVSLGTARDATAQSGVPIPPEHPRRSQEAFPGSIPVPPRLNPPEEVAAASPALESFAPVQAPQEFAPRPPAAVEPQLPTPPATAAVPPLEPAMGLAPPMKPAPVALETAPVTPKPAVQPVAKKPAAAVRQSVKALFNDRISSADKRRLKAAFNDFRRKRYSAALGARDAIKDPAARKLITWYYLRSGALGAHPLKIVSFLKDNPDWPNRDLMRRRGEFILLQQSWPADTVMAFFQDRKPMSGAGKAALGGALLQTGQDDKGAALVREAWRRHELGKAAEDKVLKRFGHLLSKADHKERADRLLYAERKRLLSAALRAAGKVGKTEHTKAKARAAVTRRARNASRLYKALSKEAKQDPGVRFNRIQYLRRKKKDEAARSLLLAAPSDPAKLVDLEAWWVERRIHCRRALNEGKPKLAYRIANDYDRLTGRYHAQATFLAGWIALRFLNDPQAAKTHFEALKSQATLDRTIARAHYWLGRTEDVLGNDEASRAQYREAGKQTRTYYGQLALQMLQRPHLRFAAPAVPTDDDINRFTGRDAVRALLIADQAGLDHLIRRFLGQLAYRVDTPGQAAMLAELTRKLTTEQKALRVSKVMLRRGLPVEHYGYPAGLLPKYRKLNGGAERALLYALARQESEFNPKAKSPVGARGLMQIMPGTARMIARDYKLRYRRSKLISDPSYNVTLGAAHIRDLLDDWRGSYILMLVSYNAGPGRAKDWIESHGDPRDPNVDPVDWVERIPFTETRNYVLKIMASIQVYRSRLEGPDSSLRLAQDLRRGQPGYRTDKRADVHSSD